MNSQYIVLKFCHWSLSCVFSFLSCLHLFKGILFWSLFFVRVDVDNAGKMNWAQRQACMESIRIRYMFGFYCCSRGFRIWLQEYGVRPFKCILWSFCTKITCLKHSNVLSRLARVFINFLTWATDLCSPRKNVCIW